MSDVTKRKKSRGGQGATRKQSPTSPEGIARLQRDLKCVQLRKSGMHWHAIANELHYSSPGHAHQRFMAVLAAYPREDIDTCRDILNDRYEAMIHVLWPKVLCGNLSAIDRATRLCEAQAKLLGANRTERPERPELSASAADLDAALRALEGELRARAGGEPIPDE